MGRLLGACVKHCKTYIYILPYIYTVSYHIISVIISYHIISYICLLDHWTPLSLGVAVFIPMQSLSLARSLSPIQLELHEFVGNSPRYVHATGRRWGPKDGLDGGVGVGVVGLGIMATLGICWVNLRLI